MKQEKSSILSRREQNKVDRRAAIVKLAMQTFLENGYEATSMSSIVEKMGGSKGTLWTYFKSKEELFEAVIDSASAAFKSFMTEILDPKKDIEVVLTRFCETFLERISRPEAIALQRLTLAQAERFPEVSKVFYDRGPSQNLARVTQYLDQQIKKGSIETGNSDEAARMLLDLCTAGYHDRVLWGLDSQNAATERRESKRIVRQFLQCYGGKIYRQKR